MDIGEILKNIWDGSGYHLFGQSGGWQSIVMIIVALFFLYLGIKKQFEPLLLVGIAFGMLLTNLPALDGDKIFHPEWWTKTVEIDGVVTTLPVDYLEVLQHGGLLDILYIGVKTGVYPCLIFIGVGAMTDFGPMLSRPSSLILGAAAQCGIYLVLILAAAMEFTGGEASSI